MFWLVLLVITIVAFAYAIEAQAALDRSGVDVMVDDIQIRDLLTAAYVLTGIALLLELFVLIVAGMYGLCRFYGSPIVVWVVYLFFVFWFVLILAGVSFSANTIATNPSTLDAVDLSIAERDLSVVQIILYTIILLLIIGFVAYIYIIEDCADFRSIDTNSGCM
jgi:hypothetical protein